MFEPTRRAPDPAPAPAIVAAAPVLPPHRYDQGDLADLARRILPDLDRRPGSLRRFFRAVGVEQRHLALPAAAYERLDGLEARNRAWLEVGLDLAERATRDLLGQSAVDAGEIDALITTTVTGLAVPSLEARLMNRIRFRSDTVRMPLFGLGCLGGAAGLARAADYLRAYPERAVVLLAVELCSLTVQRNDSSIANIISCGLFGDGAAAVLMVGGRHRLATGGVQVVDSMSSFFPDSERVMGWDVVDTGFKVVLSPDVPAVVERGLPPAVDGFLAGHGLDRDDITAWVSHPGGPKIIDAIERALQLAPSALQSSRRILAEVGNLSSASVLFLLDERLRARPAAGSPGLLMAMGPAFCAELVLLRW